MITAQTFGVWCVGVGANVYWLLQKWGLHSVLAGSANSIYMTLAVWVATLPVITATYGGQEKP